MRFVVDVREAEWMDGDDDVLLVEMRQLRGGSDGLEGGGGAKGTELPACPVMPPVSWWVHLPGKRGVTA